MVGGSGILVVRWGWGSETVLIAWQIENDRLGCLSREHQIPSWLQPS